MHESSQNNLESRLRRVRYLRHEGMGRGDRAGSVENSLLAFVYDIPHFGACGVFPPFHLLNQLLLGGGGEGGMSPGTTWKPFSISAEEYQDLAEAVRTIPPEKLRKRARFAHIQFIFDPEFDGEASTYPKYPGFQKLPFVPPELKEYFEWMTAVCAKHRHRYHDEIKRGRSSSD